MNGLGEKSSGEIAREVESSRAEVQNTLRELTEKMSAGQLVDQAMTYLKSSGGNEFVNNLGRSVRDNPLPVMMIGAGMAWLMIGGGQSQQVSLSSDAAPHPRRSPGSDTTHPLRTPPITGYRPLDAPSPSRLGASVDDGAAQQGPDGPSLKAKATEAASSVGEAVGAAAGSVAEAASSLYDRVSDTASSAYGAARSGSEAAGQAVSGVTDTAARHAGEYSDSLRDTAHRATGYVRQSWSHIVQEQPCVLGGIGLAIGAAIGAALPRTEAENRLMGDASTSLKDAVAATAGEHYQEAMKAAGTAVDEVRDTIAEYRPSKEKIADVVESAAGKVRDAVSSASETAKQRIDGLGKENSQEPVQS